jgi:hypothetical protein
MRVRVRLRVWVVLTTDRKTGKTFPFFVSSKRSDARNVLTEHRRWARETGFTFFLRPFRYDELAQARRKSRRRRKAQERSFEERSLYQ